VSSTSGVFSVGVEVVVGWCGVCLQWLLVHGVVAFNVAKSVLLGQFYRWRKRERIGFMTLKDVQRFLDEV